MPLFTMFLSKMTMGVVMMYGTTATPPPPPPPPPTCRCTPMPGKIW
jgi:hypothetical protein